MGVMDNESAQFIPRRRTAVRISPEDLVSAAPLLPGKSWPVLFTPRIDGLSLLAWARSKCVMIQEQLAAYGAVLCRGFAVKSVNEFEEVIHLLGGELLDYSYASTPRSKVSGKIYTSTEYPANQEIPLHNEMSYARRWPLKLGFYSIAAAPHGGETPLADSRRVLRCIEPAIRDKFIRRGVMYVRNYGQGVDLAWQDAFQADDRAVVEAYCRQAGIEFEWRGDDGLRTSQVCQAVATHPVTGEDVWFNQAHLFHVSSLPETLRETLLGTFAEEDLPRNAYYGDGSPIEPGDLDNIRQAYLSETVAFPWRGGDVAVLDNMHTAHGRRPFSGPRRLVVGMAGAGGENCGRG
jgi:alpha-ketoglutarate-dependent taurine dioxygenase